MNIIFWIPILFMLVVIWIAMSATFVSIGRLAKKLFKWFNKNINK
jgi:hypothetical protein